MSTIVEEAVMPSPSFVLNDETLIQLLQLSDDQLLNVAKAHFAVEVAPEFLTDAVAALPSMGLSIFGFLKERAAKPAGKHLANVVAICSSDGGENICKKLDYCNRREKFKGAVARARDAMLGKLITPETMTDAGKLRKYLEATLSPEDFTALMEFMKEARELLGPMIEFGGLFGDVVAPFVTPVSLALFTALFTLDELCQCDKRPEDRRFKRII
jgi:hypothetical protein